MYYSGNVAYALTAEQLSSVMSVNTLQTLCARNRSIRVRRGGRGVVALYDVSALPEVWRVEVYKQFPETRPRLEMSPLMDEMKAVPDAVLFFQSYVLPTGKHLSDEKVQEYANNAAILARCTEVFTQVSSATGRSGKRVPKKELWQKIADSLERLKENGWPNSLPQSGDRLRKKWQEYQAGGFETLINGRFGNTHAAKVGNGVQENLLVTLCADGRNLQDEQVCKLYNSVANAMKWEPITAGTVANWRQRHNIVTEVGRHGKNYMSNTKLMQVKRSKPTEPLMMWSADGWDVELFYQKRVNGTMTYSNRMTVVVILDAFCNYPIGYAIDNHENSDVIREALANAMQHCRELYGEMLMVDQYQSDHYAMKALQPYYAMVADKVIPARVGNAKSKPVERYFLHLNNDMCHALPNWSGFGITSKKSSQPNIDWLNMNKKNFPDEAGVIAQIDMIINKEREAKRAMMLAKGTPKRRVMDRELFLLNFGHTTGFKNSIEGCGLRVTIDRAIRQYDCFDPSWREHDDVRWTIHYDPSDLTHVLATDDKGELRYMLEEKYVQPMALMDRKEGDAAELQRIAEFNKTMVATATQRRIEADTCTENLLLGAGIDPKLSQMIITDGRGQHKNQRNALRSGQRAALPKVEDAEVISENAKEPTKFDIY